MSVTILCFSFYDATQFCIDNGKELFKVDTYDSDIGI